MKWFTAFLVTFALWLLLFWSWADPWVYVAGAALAALVATVFRGFYPERFGGVLNPVRWLFALLYLPYFLFYCIKANLDVAVRVLHPDLPIRPGIIKVSTTLNSEMAKTFLANSITLTPGTLTVDIDGQDLYVHWINIHTDDANRRTAEICGRFEPLLRRIFE